jgi:pyruvate formate lyase activating enzyme
MTTGAERTPAGMIERTVRLGRDAGLRHVYPGNIAPAPGAGDTRCPRCGRVVIARRGYTVRSRLGAGGGVCPDCGTTLAGVWE